MKQTIKRNDTWRRLYELAVDIRRLAPWEWMEEGDIFGVEDLRSGRVHFVSVMGSEGVHLAVAGYSGIEALYRIMTASEEEIYEYPETVLEIPQIQLSFEDRSQIADHAYRRIRSLGLRFRGRNAWPQFQSFSPGYAPWQLEEAEMQAMVELLEQVLDVAPRFRSDPQLLEASDPESFLVRVKTPGKETAWRDERRRFPEPDIRISPPPVPDLEVARLKKLDRAPQSVEVDFFMTPAFIGEKGTRMLNGYALMTVEANQGMIIGLEMLTADPSLRSMWDRIPALFARQLSGAGIRPEAIEIRSEKLGDFLEPLAAVLGCEIFSSDTLPNLDPAKQELIRHLGRG